uniref:Uncharacterized protein LOC104233968 isoform X6 n=1 Tax=Nicotiana sylvestris TaxID=4096 RepID=A0A1U7X0R2_NICSY|nr:PREDICTED: uncharacterized protein LOC104233968 isoform X6 [Nicotiana sylvestris]
MNFPSFQYFNPYFLCFCTLPKESQCCLFDTGALQLLLSEPQAKSYILLLLASYVEEVLPDTSALIFSVSKLGALQLVLSEDKPKAKIMELCRKGDAFIRGWKKMEVG